jgi:hypothetical protein
MNNKQQREIGIILGQLNETDRTKLISYIDDLESKLTIKPKANIETAMVAPKKVTGSKYFSETEIHEEMFANNINKVFINSEGIKYHLTTLPQILGLQEPVYKELRKKAIINLHNKRYAGTNNA